MGTFMPPQVIVLDSITHMQAGHSGQIIVAGSHCGTYSGHYAASHGARAVILNDAGLSADAVRGEALGFLDKIGIPALAVDAFSARIGWGRHMMDHGVVSHANKAAGALGCRPGQSCAEALVHLMKADFHQGIVPPYGESAVLVDDGPIPVWCLDSNSLAGPEHAGAIVITGSHGGLLGGRADTAIRSDVRAAVYHDAGIGCDRAGISRLPALDARGIAGAAVQAASARIGDAHSVLETGVLSTVNVTAAGMGITPGMTVRQMIAKVRDALGEAATRRPQDQTGCGDGGNR